MPLGGLSDSEGQATSDAVLHREHVRLQGANHGTGSDQSFPVVLARYWLLVSGITRRKFVMLRTALQLTRQARRTQGLSPYLWAAENQSASPAAQNALSTSFNGCAPQRHYADAPGMEDGDDYVQVGCPTKLVCAALLGTVTQHSISTSLNIWKKPARRPQLNTSVNAKHCPGLVTRQIQGSDRLVLCSFRPRCMAWPENMQQPCIPLA